MRLAITILIVALLCVTSACAETPVGLIDGILVNPGGFNQMCNGPPRTPRTSLPLYGYQRNWAMSYISRENFKRLRAHRVGIIKEVGSRIEATIPDVVANCKAEALRLTQAPEATPRSLGRDPFETYLVIVLDLNGIETLPTLLRLETALNDVALYSLPPKALESTSDSLLPHTQVLSVITALLKNEKARGLEQIKTPGRYDKEHRDAIVGIANDFLKTTQPKDYRGAAAITPEPTYR